MGVENRKLGARGAPWLRCSPKEEADWIVSQRFATSRAEILRITHRRLAARKMAVARCDVEDAYAEAWLQFGKRSSAGRVVGPDRASQLVRRMPRCMSPDSPLVAPPAAHLSVIVKVSLIGVDLPLMFWAVIVAV
jgi:hypothetical protein